MQHERRKKGNCFSDDTTTNRISKSTRHMRGGDLFHAAGTSYVSTVPVDYARILLDYGRRSKKSAAHFSRFSRTSNFRSKASKQVKSATVEMF